MRQSVDRHDGVITPLTEGGLDPAESLTQIEAVSHGQGFTADAGAIGAATLLGRDPAPTALFCANDQLAIGAMREIRRRGLRIPDDIAIVGYDDISVASELITPLTSVRQPMREMGAAAADLLLSTEGTIRHVVFPPELVVRESTAGRATASLNP